MLIRAKTLASIWGAIVISLVLMFWLFFAPRNYSASRETPEACNAAKPGMNMKEALTAIEAQALPHYEAIEGDTLSIGACYVEFENGKTTHVRVGGSQTIE